MPHRVKGIGFVVFVDVAGAEMALQLSLEGLLVDFSLDALFGIHFLEPSVLSLELLQALIMAASMPPNFARHW